MVALAELLEREEAVLEDVRILEVQVVAKHARIIYIVRKGEHTNKEENLN